MAYLLIRQKFHDYDQWRPAFDSLTEKRRAAGMELLVLGRNSNDQNEAVLLFRIADEERMREHAASGALRGAHESAGVIPGSTEMVFLDET